MTHHPKKFFSWNAVCVFGTILIFILPVQAWADPSGYGHGPSLEDYGHHGKSHSGIGSSHHRMSYSGSGVHGMEHLGHNKGHHPEGYRGGKNRYGGGGHQSASKFIDHVLRFKDGMGITDEQESQLREIQTEYKKTRIKMKAEVELANLDLHELLKNEQARLSDIETKLKDVHALKADLYMASIKARREAKGTLTEEQRQRMKTVHDRIKAYGSKMMKSGHSGSYSRLGKEKEKDSY